MKDSVILTDVDGVLCNWEYAFSVWMDQHGFNKVPGAEFNYDIGDRYGIDRVQAKKLIKIFNENAAIGFLPPLRDAMYYVKKLHEEHGYVFHCITSLSLDPNAQKLRIMNLRKLFGETVFEKFTILDTGADKDDALAVYKNTGCFWIEDKPANALAGHQAGLRAILMEHGHNLHFYHKDIPLVKDWHEIYRIIAG